MVLQKINTMKKIILLTLLICTVISGYAQKDSFEAELSANLSAEFSGNGGDAGIIGSAGMNYYFVDRIGLNTNIGGFQSFIEWKWHNSSFFKWDADLFFDVLRTKKDHRLRLSTGASWFRGATSAVSAYSTQTDGTVDIISYRNYFHNGIGVNFKIQYRFPIAEKWYLGINGEFYWLPNFYEGTEPRTNDYDYVYNVPAYVGDGIIPVLGVTVGYKF